MNRLITAMRMCVGGTVCGSFAGSFAGGLLGALVGAARGDAAVGLDGALLGGGIGGLGGALYGVILALYGGPPQGGASRPNPAPGHERGNGSQSLRAGGQRGATPREALDPCDQVREWQPTGKLN